MTPRKMLALALGTALSGTAWAGHGKALLTIDNDFDGPAQVFVDGRYAGEVHGDRTQNFAIRPGRRLVQVKTQKGYPLVKARVRAHPRRRARVEVDAPAATLSLKNTGHDRVWLQVDGRDVSLSGHQLAKLRVESGHVDLVIERRTRFGDAVVQRQTVWAEPGTLEAVRLDPVRAPVHAHAAPHRRHATVAWHDDDDHRRHRQRWDRDDDRWDDDDDHRKRRRYRRDRDDDDRWDRDDDDRWDRDDDDDDRRERRRRT